MPLSDEKHEPASALAGASIRGVDISPFYTSLLNQPNMRIREEHFLHLVRADLVLLLHFLSKSFLPDNEVKVDWHAGMSWLSASVPELRSRVLT